MWTSISLIAGISCTCSVIEKKMLSQMKVKQGAIRKYNFFGWLACIKNIMRYKQKTDIKKKTEGHDFNDIFSYVLLVREIIKFCLMLSVFVRNERKWVFAPGKVHKLWKNSLLRRFVCTTSPAPDIDV